MKTELFIKSAQAIDHILGGAKSPIVLAKIVLTCQEDDITAFVTDSLKSEPIGKCTLRDGAEEVDIEVYGIGNTKATASFMAQRITTSKGAFAYEIRNDSEGCWRIYRGNKHIARVERKDCGLSPDKLTLLALSCFYVLVESCLYGRTRIGSLFFT
jgi:hypothetical protein